MPETEQSFKCDTCTDDDCAYCESYYWSKPLVDETKKKEVVQKLKELLGPKMFKSVFMYVKWDAEDAATEALPMDIYLQARKCLREISNWMEEAL